jgi:hypothetical protein
MHARILKTLHFHCVIMEQQIKCLLERFEQRILIHIKKECPEFAETYDEKILYEPSRSVYLRNNTIKLIFNEIYSSMRDYVAAETHGFSLDKINTYTNSIETKTYTSCELSVGKGLYLLAQGESNSIDKLRSVIEASICDTTLREIISECYRLWKRLINIGRANEIYQLNHIEWLPITFIKDLVYSVRKDPPNSVARNNKL